MSDPGVLADELESAAREMIEFLRSISDDEAATILDDEQWPISVAAHHVAIGAQFTSDLAVHVAQGGEISWTMDFIDVANDQHSQVFGDVTRPEAIEALDIHLPASVQKVRDLRPEGLRHRVEVPMVYGDHSISSAEEVIRVLMIGHVNGHLLSMKLALGAERS